jgi:hypothetical protein
MTITVGAAAQKAVQTQAQAGKSAQSQEQSHKSETQPQSNREGRNAVAKAALTPALRQAAQLVAGPLGEVAVTMAAGAVGALLDTRA